jgi:phosphoribosylpyrophosphate synthetase
MFPADAPLFGADGPDEVIVTDSIPIAAALLDKVTVIEVAPLLGDVVARLHDGRPVSELIPYD